ncbi:MAG TPA: alkaline phosphatase family protein [Jatrophihabitans sp.]|nr:alkaline phosphatase family protein [Jatrophihabitans sp.]
MNRALALLGATMVAAALPSVTPAGATAPLSPSAAIRHVVVMTQGGRSFDNYFGRRPGVDGIPATSCQLPSSAKQPVCIAPHVLTPASRQLPLLSTAGIEAASINHGGMNGFVRAQASDRSDGMAADGYFRPGSLPLLDDISRRAVLFDHWFAGVPGGTVANRFFGITAKPPGDRQQVPPQGWPVTPTIFDRLSAAGVSWRVYVQNYEPALTIDTASTKQLIGGQVPRVPLLAMRRFLDDPALSSHVMDLDRYYSDLAANRLPALSWIVSTSTTEQAPQDPTRGQQLSRAVINALLMSSAWQHAAFLLSYDDSGGWFDHVRPPTVAGATVGLRVPTMLLSPYAVPGSVNHATFDAASTLKLIEQVWRLAPLSVRDLVARSPLSAFDFNRTPQTTSLIAVPGGGPVPQPRRLVLYLGYLAAFCVVLGLWAVGYRSAQRPLPQPPRPVEPGAR